LTLCQVLNIIGLSMPSNIRIPLHSAQATAGSVDKDTIENRTKWSTEGKVVGDQPNHRSALSRNSVS
jgi:hypothetical protein